MKKVWVALVCTLGIVACGKDNPEPQAPSTTGGTSETTGANNGAMGTSANATPMGTSGNTGAMGTAGNSGATGTGAMGNTGNAGAMSTGTTGSGTGNTGSGNTGTGNTGNTGTGNAGSMAPSTMGTPSTSDNPGVANGTSSADNTKINDRDRHGAVTPGDQGGGKDRDITAAVRRSVVGDSSLSFNAKNIKIITVGGKVTLRGPVASEKEKATIESKAKATPGVTDVDDQLEVKK